MGSDSRGGGLVGEGARTMRIGVEFFFIDRGKILMTLELVRRPLRAPRQNIDSRELTGKIFRNKELTAAIADRQLESPLAPDLPRIACMIPFSAFCVPGKGCSSHGQELFLERLWKKEVPGE